MNKLKLIVMGVLAFGVSAGAWTQDGIPRPEKSVAQLEAQAARNTNDPRLLQQLGTAYFYQARGGEVPKLAKAIDALERSVALAPDDAAAQRALGVSYLMKVGVLAQSQASPQEMIVASERALAAFERVLAQAPNEPLSLSSHGMALTILARFKQSQEPLMKGLEELNRAVKVNPKSLSPRLNRGFTIVNFPLAMRDQKATLEDLSAILNALPEGYNERAQGALHVLLGDAYLEAKETTRATAEYDAAAKLSVPAAEEARARLAAIKQGQPVEQAMMRYRGSLNHCAMCHGSR